MEINMKIGFLINPIAGMGGSVGLKGTDGEEILSTARELGAEPQATQRAREFLYELRGLKKKLTFITIAGVMGGDLVQEFEFNIELITDPALPDPTLLFETRAEHTKIAAQLMKNLGVALILFVGGDGTARNVFEAVGTDIPCLGIPGGVKIHSSVFAINPKTAGLLTLAYLWGEAPTRESEVLDIDEDAFRDNRVISKLYGYLITPYSPTYSQPSKEGTPNSEEEHMNQAAIGQYVVEEMAKFGDDWYWLIGPGTTTRAITQVLNIDKTLLGVDFLYQNQIVAYDLNEQQILEQIKDKQVKLIVSPIGAQGFIFGRGNLQLSAQVLRKIGNENIIIIATKYKMSTLPEGIMRTDSRDSEFDDEFAGLYRVIVDYAEIRLVNIKPY
jgi:predicted polyphosphate/ATP-dependent NAD kinase